MTKILRRKLRKHDQKKKITFSEPLPDDWEIKPLFSALSDNQDALEQMFTNCADIVLRNFTISNEKIPALLIFIKEIANEEKISNFIIKPLMELNSPVSKELCTNMFIEKLINEDLKSSDIEVAITFGQAVNTILTGNTLLVVDGYKEGVRISTRGRKYREIHEPTTEGTLTGPKEGFTESIATNTVLIRDRIITSKLKVEKYVVGRVSKTNLNLMYIEGIVNPELVENIRSKIQNIDIDGVLGSQYIEELIVDNPKTIFPLINRSERPDKIAADLLEGRIAILVEGTPFVLIAPGVFVQFMQTSEDYYQNYFFASFMRMVRYILLIISFISPGVYLAAITFHQELLPTDLAYSIASARKGVPFPAFLEILLMALMFEAFREAGVRLPKQIGQSVSIVGALIIGESAVAAKLVSPATVIIIAVTGVSSFTIPSHDFSQCIRMLVFPIILLGGSLGLYGVMLGSVVILIHLASLDSFGVPYLASFAPFSLKDMKDAMIRTSRRNMNERPSFLNITNMKRKNNRS